MNPPSSPMVSTVANSSLTGLPLRHDDPVSFSLILKVLLITTLLLVVTYVILRWYARRNNPDNELLRSEAVSLRCLAALRLSTRTKVYLLKAGDSEVMITETPSGVHVTRLFKKQENISDKQSDNQERIKK